MKLVNRAKMSMTTTGAGVMTLGSAVAGYQTFVAAGVLDQDVLPYAIEDGSAWEIGYGLYTAVGTTWTRSTVLASSGGGSAISCSSSALIFVTPLATTLTETPVRQTVLSGPTSAGAPSFLPATSSSLSLASQNITPYAPLIVTAGQGFNAGGALDYVLAIANGMTWSGLTASATVYLYVNAVTGALGSTTLQPIYQYGGTISTVSGQFTFDFQAMIGWVGNGSAAVQTPIVFIGECVTGASTITSVIPYSYCGLYDSGYVATLPGASTVVSKNCYMGLLGYSTTLQLKNTTAEGGYYPGDVVEAISVSTTNGAVAALTVWGERNYLGFTAGANNAFYFVSKSNGGPFNPTSGNWSYRLFTRRGW